MYAHYLHGRSALSLRQDGFAAVFAHLGYPLVKAPEPAPGPGLELPRQLEEPVQPGAARLAVRQRGADGIAVQAAVQLRYQGGQLGLAGKIAQEGDGFHEPAALAVLRGAGVEGVPQLAVPVREADGGELVGCKSEQGRAQHAHQLHVLARVVYQGEQREHHLHLSGFKKAAGAPGLNGDAHAGQLTPPHGAGHVCRAEQHGDVAIIHGPLPAGRGEHCAALHQLAHAFCRVPRLQRRPVRALGVLFRTGGGQHGEFGLRHRAFIRQGRRQTCAFVVVQLAEAAAHQAGEHAVDSGDHLRPGAEALAQEDAPRLTRRGGRVGKALVFLQEYRGIGQAEAVDALLDVTDHEELAPAAGDGVDYLLLYARDVLVFVYHDLGIALRELHGEGCGRAVPAAEQLRGQVFRVGEVQQRAAALAARVLRVELQRQREQRVHGAGSGADVAQQRRAGGGKVLLQPGHGLLALVAAVFYYFLELLFALERLQPGEGHGQRLTQRVPAAPGGGHGRLYAIQRGTQALAVGFFGGLAGRHLAEDIFQFPPPVAQAGESPVQKFAAPGGVRSVLRQVVKAALLGLGPLLRTGVCLQFFVQREQQALQPRVVPPRADRVRQREEARFSPLIRRLQHGLQRGGFELRGALLVTQAEHGVQPQPRRVLPQQRYAEAVDGADLRAPGQRALPSEPGGIRPRQRRALRQIRPYLAAQLFGRRAREGDDEEAVHIHGVLRIQYVTHEPLYEHTGLAAARSSRDEGLPSPVIYGQRLARRGFELRHCPRLLPASPTPSWP